MILYIICVHVDNFLIQFIIIIHVISQPEAGVFLYTRSYSVGVRRRKRIDINGTIYKHDINCCMLYQEESEKN